MTERELVPFLTDDAYVRQEIREILEIHGYRVIAVETIADALAVVHEHQPDLMIVNRPSDIVTESNLYKQIHANRTMNHMRVLFLPKMKKHPEQRTIPSRADEYIVDDLISVRALLRLVENKLRRPRLGHPESREITGQNDRTDE